MPRSDILHRPPGHARVLGTPRSGKTSLLVERFHHLARAGHRPLVIAFGREQRDRLLERLIPAGTARFGPAPVTTHGLLAERVLAAARPGRARTLRDVDERVVLDRLLAAQPVLLRSDLRSIAGSPALHETLLRVLHALAQNGVAADRADAVAGAAGDARARDVFRVFAAYRRHLDDRRLVTFYDAAWEAARAVAADRSLAAAAGANDVVLVDDFQDLDAGQFELLRAVAPPDGPVALEVFGDPTGPRFSFRGTSDRFLAGAFSASYRPEEFRLPAAHPSHAALARCIDALCAAADTRAELSGAAPSALSSLPLFAAAPAPVEAGVEWPIDFRAALAHDELAEAQHAALCVRDWIAGGIAPGDIAVVTRDPERVASVVHHAFRERGVPVDAGARADSAADAFVHALVGALGRDADGRFAASLEASPLLEEFCATGGLPRDPARAAAALRAAYSSRGAPDLERLLRERTASLAPAETIERVADEWRRYAEVVAHAGGQVSLDEFRRAYLDDAARESAGGNAPRLVSARAMSGRTVRAAVVMGCADGIFPRVEVEAGYLPPVVLAAALSGVDEDAARDMAARGERGRAEREEAALMVSALSCARDALCLSHPRRSGDQALTIPPALAPLFVGAHEVGRNAPAAFRAAALVAGAPADRDLAAAVAADEPMAAGWIRPEPAPRRPVFEELALSPSRLQTFTACERKFFFQRVLRIEEPGSIHLDIGSVFHEVLKELVPAGARGEEVRAALQSESAAAAIDRALSALMPDAGEWLRALTTVHMRHMLEGVRELEARREGNYRVLSVETAARYPAQGRAVLAGRLDRIDEVEGLGPVVVDYKTSASISKTAASILSEIEEKRAHWQVAVYSALAGALGHDAKAFLYYVVPPGEEVNAVGLQLAGGELRDLVRTGGREKARFDFLPAGTLRDVLDDAMKIHADVLAGACAYARTDDLEQCKNCHFIRVCRRSGE